MLASNTDQTRRVTMQVKAKYGGNAWQTTTLRGKPYEREVQSETLRFWALVVLRDKSSVYDPYPLQVVVNDSCEPSYPSIRRASASPNRGSDGECN